MRRRLTPIERIMWTLGEVTPVAFAVTARIHGSRDVQSVRAAIEAVTERHELLRVRIGGPGRMTAWLTDTDAPAPTLTISRGTDWETAVAEDLRRPFHAEQGPLARFLLLDNGHHFHLALVCHHVIGDGLALAHVLRDVVQRLADPSWPCPPVKAPTMHDLAWSLPAPPRSGRFRQPHSPWPVRPRQVAEGAEFAITSWTIEPDESRAFQERCRAEQTSVHAALGLAGLRALVARDGVSRRQLFTPVNTRPVLNGLPEGALGDYAIELFTWVDLAESTDFWTAARTLRHTLRRQTAPDRVIRQIRLLTLFGILPNRAMSRLLRISCKPQDSFTFTNMGRMPFVGTYGDLRIEELYCAVHMGTLTNGLLSAMTIDDRICLAMSTREADRAAVSLFTTAIQEQLREALG